MSVETKLTVWCPGCDGVREIDASPCPNCGRCVFCGRKISADQACECGRIQDPAAIARLFDSQGIAEESVDRERRRAELRRKWQFRKGMMVVCIFGVIMQANSAYWSFSLQRPIGSKLLVATRGVVTFLIAWGVLELVFKLAEDWKLRTEQSFSE